MRLYYDELLGKHTYASVQVGQPITDQFKDDLSTYLAGNSDFSLFKLQFMRVFSSQHYQLVLEYNKFIVYKATVFYIDSALKVLDFMHDFTTSVQYRLVNVAIDCNFIVSERCTTSSIEYLNGTLYVSKYMPIAAGSEVLLCFPSQVFNRLFRICMSKRYSYDSLYVVKLLGNVYLVVKGLVNEVYQVHTNNTLSQVLDTCVIDKVSAKLRVI